MKYKYSCTSRWDHLSSANTFPKYQKFPSKITIFGTSCKRALDRCQLEMISWLSILLRLVTSLKGNTVEKSKYSIRCSQYNHSLFSLSDIQGFLFLSSVKVLTSHCLRKKCIHMGFLVHIRLSTIGLLSGHSHFAFIASSFEKFGY